VRPGATARLPPGGQPEVRPDSAHSSHRDVRSVKLLLRPDSVPGAKKDSGGGDLSTIRVDIHLSRCRFGLIHKKEIQEFMACFALVEIR
jgi:phosphatidate phosphatase APP1